MVSWMKSYTASTGVAKFSVVNAPPPGQPGLVPPLPVGVPELPQGLAALLILGILFVLAIIIYTVLQR